MTIEEQAKTFAIKAHLDQVRKSEPDKPMIIHPISVANIIAYYGFDSNVIAAGYLHDVVEDTKYNQNDILDNFGDDISSLVETATEPDKTLPWEERKQHTIDVIKNADMRHKAIVCADKINNLEDMRILFNKKGKQDFSAFKRGFDKQKWYYENIYESLIYNEDKTNPMFIRLKEVIDDIFYNKKDEYLENIFSTNKEYYKDLLRLKYKDEENKKLSSLISHKPYIIEFTGTPRTGKTSIIDKLYDFFTKSGYKVSKLEEFTTSKKYKTTIKPLLDNKPVSVINTEIPKYVLKELNETITTNPDIILIDRSLFDRLIWVDRLYQNKGMITKEYNDYKKTYIPLIKENIDIIIATYTDSLTAMKRDYNQYLSLEKRHFLNEDNINSYNNSLDRMLALAHKSNINAFLFDTTNFDLQTTSITVLDKILDNIRYRNIQIFEQEIDK